MHGGTNTRRKATAENAVAIVMVKSADCMQPAVSSEASLGATGLLRMVARGFTGRPSRPESEAGMAIESAEEWVDEHIRENWTVRDAVIGLKERDAAIRESERQVIVARLRVMARTIDVPPAALVERFGSNTGKLKAAMLEAIRDVIETCADQIALTSEAAK